MIPEQIQSRVYNLLGEKLPSFCCYHSITHTKDVVKSVKTMAARQRELSPGSISDVEIDLLVTAALFHDTGFTRKYEMNEPEGAIIAREILPEFGFTQTEIEEVAQLILATQHGHSAVDISEKIIQDADLYYLATDAYEENSELLREEWLAAGKHFTNTEWKKLQLQFLSTFSFKSEAGIDLGTEGLRKNINRLLAER